jgi:putative membrane protein
MTRAAWLALSIGIALFIALLTWQGFGSVVSTLAVAGWGLLFVVAFHLVPVLFDAAAIDVLLARRRDGASRTHGTLRTALLARWAGESVNSLMPAGQLGGPVLMVRHLSQRGIRAADAAAVITVSTTLQTLAQMVFAVLGIAVFVGYQAQASTGDADGGADLRLPLVVVTALCAALLYGFYAAQRRGLFGRLMRLFARLGERVRRPGNWASWFDRADAVDAAVQALYRQRGKAAWSFSLSMAGWIVGTGEVWLGLNLIGHSVSWVDALLLESLGQAIRGAAFAVPGSLGVQEGGYLLLAPLVGLPPDAALALSLIKRAREILLGLPGLVYLHFSERGWRRRRAATAVPVTD